MKACITCWFTNIGDDGDFVCSYAGGWRKQKTDCYSFSCKNYCRASTDFILANLDEREEEIKALGDLHFQAEVWKIINLRFNINFMLYKPM